MPLTPYQLTSVLISSIGILFSLTLHKIEVRAGEYVPPRREDASRSQGTGARGCNNKAQNIDLQLLAPSERTLAKTVSEHPTFAWYLSAPAMVRFTLVDPEAVEPVFETNLDGTPGVMQLQLPAQTRLVIGKKYVWTVAVICSRYRPSSNIYARAWIERIQVSPELERNLAIAKNNRERKQVYEAAGIWYDAIAEIPLKPAQ